MQHRKTYVVVALLVIAAASASAQIPERPEQLFFPSLSYELPDADSMRFELENGIPVYARQDTQLPLINLSIHFKGGRYLVPPGREGLTAIASRVWRTGGAGERTGQELDEELDFLAATIATDVGETNGSVNLNVMSKDLSAAMAILMDVLTDPVFQEDRFLKAKEDLLQGMRRRNDDTADIESREWNRLIYGDDYWMNQLATSASVESITAEDCRSFVTSLVRAGNVIVAVAGDFTREGITETLNGSIGQLDQLEREIPPVPQPQQTAQPGVYVVHKSDVNQGRVRLGHLGLRLGHPDEFALRVGNDILGGGGFTSRIVKRVRSDEGLAYSAGSSLSFPMTIPGVFSARFQTKSSTCAYATEITVGLIDQFREETVSSEELETAKASFIETFPRRFESPTRTVQLFAIDEVLGRPTEYWSSYRERIDEVDAESILEASQRLLNPSNLVYLFVGNVEEIMAGHPDHEAHLMDFGEITTIPLRDPMTLEPLQ